jgi:hypothetical protein
MPRCFGAISAYDGHPAGVGRIVCDATWHHFINLNLNGGEAPSDAKGAERIGLYVRGCDGSKAPTAEFLKIQTYFHNTIRWLAPPGLREPLMLAAVARFDIAALELRLPRQDPDWSQLLEIGRELQDVIDRRFGPGALTTVVDDMLNALGEGSGLAELLHSRAALKARECSGGVESLLPLADMRRAVLASLVNVLARFLPADECELECLMEARDALALEVTEKALVAAEKAIAAYLERASARPTVVSNCSAISPSKRACRPRASVWTLRRLWPLPRKNRCVPLRKKPRPRAAGSDGDTAPVQPNAAPGRCEKVHAPRGARERGGSLAARAGAPCGPSSDGRDVTIRGTGDQKNRRTPAEKLRPGSCTLSLRNEVWTRASASPRLWPSRNSSPP